MQTFTQFFETKEGKKPSKKTYDYSSVLYLLPDAISKKIYKWGLDHVTDEHLYQDPEDPTFGREDEMHCTVLYGIHDKRSTKVRQILKSFAPFDVKLGKISAFTAPEKFDVLKVEVMGKKLHELHDYLKDNLEVTESFPEYKPHVTIAYLKKGKSEDFVGSNKFSGVSLHVDKVVFSSSIGVKIPIKIND
jgi:2'-5' RNA ligase